MFFKRSSEKLSQVLPPVLLASPLTDRSWSGAFVPMPTLPLLPSMRILSVPKPVALVAPVLNKKSAAPAPARLTDSMLALDTLLVELVTAKNKGSEPPVVVLVLKMTAPSLAVLGLTSNLSPGLAVPMPTLPLAEISIELVGAPGRMRKGRREPPVTSRTKKFASLAPMSQVCAPKPPAVVCSSRWAGVSLAVMCRSNTGVPVLIPTLPVLLTLSELAGAPASTSNRIVPVSELPVAPWSTKARKLAPPLAELFARICQLLVGNPAEVLVSSNWIRSLFSFNLIVSKPKLSLLTQSSPTQVLPCTIRSSAIT